MATDLNLTLKLKQDPESPRGGCTAKIGPLSRGNSFLIQSATRSGRAARHA